MDILLQKTHGDRGLFSVYDLLRSFKEKLVSATQIFKGKPV